MTAECNWCDQPYHLNQRNDIEAKDCGQVWIDEQYLALQFACNTCLGEGDGAPPITRAAPDPTALASTRGATDSHCQAVSFYPILEGRRSD